MRARKILADLKKAADDEAAAGPVTADEAPLTPAERLRRMRLNDAQRELATLERDIAAKTAEEAQLRQTLTAYQKRIEATPTRESELIELTRDYGTLQSMYQGLLAKKQESQISANLERRQIGEQFRILDPARLPSRPFTPNRPRFYGVGILGGIVVGLALALLLEYLDRTLRSEDDVRVAIGLPVLAAIPLIQRAWGPSPPRPYGAGCRNRCRRRHRRRVRGAQVREVAMYEQYYGLARTAVRSVAESAVPVPVEDGTRRRLHTCGTG